MQIEFTLEEAQNLVNIIDLAVKAGGLSVSEIALPIFHKIKAAAEVPPPVANTEVISQ